MQPSPDANQVFLSYAATDRERAMAIADALERAGVPVWIDRRSIAGGDLWATGIAQAIRNCAALVILCTPASVTSRNVRQELQLAWDFDRPIFPLLLESISFPDEIAYFVHGRQWIELLDFSDSQWVGELVRVISSATTQSHGQSRDKATDLASSPSIVLRTTGIPISPTELDWPRAGTHGCDATHPRESRASCHINRTRRGRKDAFGGRGRNRNFH